MNDSDDYIPNAEVNTSNLSGMDKLSDKSESDAEEINDVLLKNLESDVFHMQNEVKQKEHEMQKLLADLQSKYYAEKDYEFSQIVDAYEQKIRELSERIQELDETAKQEREQKAKYFAVVATLENENERLRDENRRHLTEIFALNDRIQKMMHFNPNRSTANSSESMNAAITSPKGAQVNAKQKNDRNRQGFMLDFADDVSASEFDTAIIKSGDLGHHIDEAWINKFEFVKEKLLNEQSRNRELEFMIVTQKNIIDNTNENMTKLKQENADLEKRIEKKRAEIDNLHQTRIIEKTKIDSVITFCELMENCVFPQAELVEKLSELPLMISSYLRGRSETIAFNKELSAHSKLVSSAKKIKVILDQVEEKVEKGENQYKAGLVASELDDIKHGITNLTQFLSKALPSTETPPRKTSDPQERKYSGEKSNYRDTMPMERMNYIKSSTLLAKAVQNSNSLLWNYKRAHPGSRGVSAER